MSADVGWNPGSTTFTKSGSRSLLGFLPLRIQCIKSTQLATEHAQLNNCQPYPTSGVSLSSAPPLPGLFYSSSLFLRRSSFCSFLGQLLLQISV